MVLNMILFKIEISNNISIIKGFCCIWQIVQVAPPLKQTKIPPAQGRLVNNM